MKTRWTDHVRNEVLHVVKEDRENKLKAKWIGHILCRNCLLEHVTEGKSGGRIEVMGR
jgi:hypothetical protein